MEKVILGIETSCDETSAAVVVDEGEVLSNVVASSEDLHKKTGGIVPEVAAREQIKCILPVIGKAVNLAFGSNGFRKLDAVAVTRGHGLIGSLMVGMETAKTISWVFGLDLIPVMHLLGHLYSPWLEDKKRVPELPALGLVVSGGHTDLVLMHDHGKFEWLGGTRDDAAGEAFDKGAKMLNLGYPGGPEIESAAEHGNSSAFDFPRPMMERESLEFSFSGLKTALFYLLRERPKLLDDKQAVFDLAASYQEAVVDVLVKKSLDALNQYEAQSLILGGGVAANQLLKERMSEVVSVPLFFPRLEYCTDNAAMIAVYALYNYQPSNHLNLSVDPNLSLQPFDEPD